ncbi:helix-turn-helix transcriptional regulator [Microbulbifer taiwanensis]|uniref:Helix-turn-helix transcriptional regulator n=1 Tax=Microbulbifer taiwanensis TaxID=986746 RepID=A0ABW1YNE6_9GAMM|nr:helix-turn-helix transcriptional regulator [Microbulbifer taiwanensis]
MRKKLNDLPTFSGLLDKLYMGADESDPWHSFLTALIDILDLQYSTLMLRPPCAADSGLLFAAGGDETVPATMMDGADNSHYTDNYYTMDPLINLPVGKVVLMEDVIPRDQLVESDYYKLFLHPFSIAHIAGMDLLDDRGKRFCLRLTRGPQQPSFTAQEKAFMQLLAPHLCRAVSQGVRFRQLDSERQVYAQSISKRAIGIINLDKYGEILELNPAAQKILNDRDGLNLVHRSLQIRNGKLHEKLKQCIDEALNAKHEDVCLPINAIAIPRLSGKADYELVIKPLPVEKHIEAEGTARAMILIQDPEQSTDVSVRLVMHLYGLTMSEATLAIVLSTGKTMEEAASSLGVTKNTARAHLRAIFAKTGVTQQSMLVSLVLQSLASVS